MQAWRFHSLIFLSLSLVVCHSTAWSGYKLVFIGLHIWNDFYHRLRGGASPVLTATGFVNGKRQFSTPYRIDSPQPITKTIVTSDFVGDPYSCATLNAYTSTDGFWAHGLSITKIIFIYTPFWEHLQVKPVDGFSLMMAQTTRTRARMCFLGFVHMACHIGDQTLPKPPILERE